MKLPAEVLSQALVDRGPQERATFLILMIEQCVKAYVIIYGARPAAEHLYRLADRLATKGLPQ